MGVPSAEPGRYSDGRLQPQDSVGQQRQDKQWDEQYHRHEPQQEERKPMAPGWVAGSGRASPYPYRKPAAPRVLGWVLPPDPAPHLEFIAVPPASRG
jgi:hypothetical protein